VCCTINRISKDVLTSVQAAIRQTSDIALYPALCCIMLGSVSRAAALGSDIVVEVGVSSGGGPVNGSLYPRGKPLRVKLVLSYQLVSRG